MKTLSISEAKKSLGAIADSAWENEPVILVRGERLLILQRYDPEPPLRQLPPGYLDDFYSNDPDADLLNLAARSSVSYLGDEIPAPALVAEGAS